MSVERLPYLVDARKVKVQVEEWRKHLLDLTASNPLLCLDKSRASKLLVSIPELRQLLQLLQTDGKLQLPHISVEGRGRAARVIFEPGQVSFALRREDPPEPDLRKNPAWAIELRNRLRRLYENGRASLQERGVWTLHLAFGLLRWRDERLGQASSPVLLLPCELQRARGSGRLTLVASDEEPYLNPALRIYLRTYLKVELEDPPDTDDLPALDDWLEQQQPFHQTDLELLKEVWLATFHFESLALFEDLGRLTDEAASHPVVADLAGALSAPPDPDPGSSSRGTGFAPVFGESHAADALPSRPETRPAAQATGTPPLPLPSQKADRQPVSRETQLVYLPFVHSGGDGQDLHPLGTPAPVLETDSSQYQAVALASHGQNLVLHGPPGTGKSQTIAAIIADALAQGKRVLFVSAKMAALEVVYSRLKELGLHRYCLEIHGVLSKRSRVVAELGSALEEAREVREGPKSSAWVEFRRLSEKLNDLAAELHAERGETKISLLGALARLGQLSQQLAERDPVAEFRPGKLRAPLPWSDLLMVTQSQLSECLDTLRELAGLPGHTGRRENPWYGFNRIDLSRREMEAIADRLEQAAATCRSLLQALRSIDSSGRCFRPTLANVTRLASSLAAGAADDSLPAGWPGRSAADLRSAAGKLQLAASRAKIREALQERLRRFSSRPPREIISVLGQFHPLYATPVRFFMPGWYQWQRKARRCFGAAIRLTPDLARNVARLARITERLERWYTIRRSFWTRLTGRSLPFEEKILRAESDRFLRAASLHKELGQFGLHPEACFESDGRLSPHGRELVRLHQCESLRQLSDLGKDWRDGLLDPSGLQQLTIEEISRRIDILAASFDTDAGAALKEWMKRNALLARSRELNLEGFLQRYGEDLPATLAEEFEYRFWSLWIDAVLEASPELKKISQSQGRKWLDGLVEADRNARRESLELALSRASRTAASCHSLEPLKLDKPLRFLRREIAKQRNHAPIRRLLAEAWDAVGMLKPCFMMSPLSVSSYLPPRTGLFDLAIFDEASQIPTPEALPAILRARQVIVAGDSMQLPPTSFFRSSLPEDSGEEDGEGESEGATDTALAPLASILDECKTARRAFIETYLRWHYRSRDERLILFSNKHFYENRLMTFPSPTPSSTDLGVRFVHVPDGLYERGGRRVNIPEAKAVVRQLRELAREFPGRSIGVITLNLNQAEAIEDELQSEGGDLLASLESGRPETFFIKPLENVQGDERDIIVISLGYGYHEGGGSQQDQETSGRRGEKQDGDTRMEGGGKQDPQTGRSLSTHFGPISQQGGEKRLNVLITRARYLCVLVSSLKASDLASRMLSGRGAILLRDFLEYAEGGGQDGQRKGAAEMSLSPNLHQVLAESLKRKGLRTGLLIGGGRLLVPLAVSDGRNNAAGDGYRFAIECFGWQQPWLSNARDREILWPAVLEKLGWRYLRFWPIDWLDNRRQTAEDLAMQCLLSSD